MGAVTWANGTGGTVGAVSAVNSLVGSTAGDQVGIGGVRVLTNGNYVVNSDLWDLNASVADVGAVTWGNGTTGISGAVSAANSLVGSSASDQVGYGGVAALSNGNYVVGSNFWDLSASVADAGAVTWGNGVIGTKGPVSSANSLVGSRAGDYIGNVGVKALTNGNYVVNSTSWDLSASVANVGAVTWGNGSTGTTGAVSFANSLVGSTASDQVGYGGVTALTNGNYIVRSFNWDLSASVADVGAVTWGNGATGTKGPVSSANSLVGSTAGDRVGNYAVTALSNGNYVVPSTSWDLSASVADTGAVTWGDGTTGVKGPILASNSVLGATASGGGSMNFAFNYLRNYLVVGRPADNIVTVARTAGTSPGLNVHVYLPRITK